MMSIERKKMNESNHKTKKFKLLSVKCLLITVCVLLFCTMLVSYLQIADVREKLSKADYDNNYLEGVALMLEDGYTEINDRISILEDHVDDIEKRLNIIERMVDSSSEFKRLR